MTLRPTIAHRAGAFEADLHTLGGLRKLGLFVDASLSPVFPQTELVQQLGVRNRPFYVDGILELPVTYYTQGGIGSRKFLRLVDVEATSLREFKSVMEQAKIHDVSAVNVLMHSFSFVRDGVPNEALMERFDRFLKYVEDDPEIHSSTTTEFYLYAKDHLSAVQNEKPFEPITGWWLTYLRAVEDIGEGWRNFIFVVTPAFGTIGAALLGFYCFRHRR